MVKLKKVLRFFSLVVLSASIALTSQVQGVYASVIPPTLDTLNYDYEINTLSGSGSCAGSIIYGEMYDSNGTIYMSGNLNTNTNSVCVDGRYEFSFNFSYWNISRNFDLNNTNELRVYSIDRSDPQPKSPPLVAYFTRTIPYQTPAGNDVSVVLNEGTEDVTVTFDTTTSGGTTTVSASSLPTPSTGFSFKYGTPAHYLSFSTSATFTGGVKICVNYDPETISGNENNLKMSQFDSGWFDITTSLDTENNILCGTAPSL